MSDSRCKVGPSPIFYFKARVPLGTEGGLICCGINHRRCGSKTWPITLALTSHQCTISIPALSPGHISHTQLQRPNDDLQVPPYDRRCASARNGSSSLPTLYRSSDITQTNHSKLNRPRIIPNVHEILYPVDMDTLTRPSPSRLRSAALSPTRTPTQRHIVAPSQI